MPETTDRSDVPESNADNAQAVRDWAARWRQAGPVLEGIRFLELQAMSDDQRSKALENALQCYHPGVPNGPEGWLAWQKVRERWVLRQNSATR